MNNHQANKAFGISKAHKPKQEPVRADLTAEQVMQSTYSKKPNKRKEPQG